MTPREMPAGRELDALVADKVMGWGWMRARQPEVLPPHRWLVPPDEYGDWGHVFPATGDEPTEDAWWLHGRVPPGCAVVPHYSTDIAAAWTVVEKLSGFDGDRERPWWSMAVFHAQKNQVMAVVYANEPGWRVDNTDERIAEGHGWTAPEAICRAALAALAACGQDVRRVPSGRDHQPVRCGGTEET